MNRQRRGARARRCRRSRAAAAGGDVGRDVALRQLELVVEAAVEDAPLVPVLFRPRVEVLVADVADLERHVAAERALDADRVRVHARRLQVAVLREDVDVVRRRRRDRIDRRFGRKSAAPSRDALAEEHRIALARKHERVARGEVARDVDRAAGVAARVDREAVDALLVVAERVAGADRRLLGIAEQRPQPAVLDVRPPRDAERSARSRTSWSCAPACPARSDRSRGSTGRRTAPFGLKRLQPAPSAPLPSPEMPQMSSSVASDQVLSAGVNGMCRSQRRPAVKVSAGVDAPLSPR